MTASRRIGSIVQRNVMVKSGTFLRHVVIAVAVVLAAGLMIFGALVWRSSQRLSAKLATLRATGEPLSIGDLAPESVAAGENAAAYLQRIAQALVEFENDCSEYEGTPGGKWLEDFAERGEPPTAEELAAIESILNRHPEILDGLAQAARCEAYASMLDYTLPHPNFIAATLPLQNRTRGLAR